MERGAGKDSLGRAVARGHAFSPRRLGPTPRVKPFVERKRPLRWEPNEEWAANPEVELVMNRVGGLKRRLSLTPARQLDFSGLTPDISKEPFGLRILLRTDERLVPPQLGITRTSDTTVLLTLTFEQFISLYYFVYFYRENPICRDEVAKSALRMLRDAGIVSEPIRLEVSLYRKLPGVVRRVASGVNLFEAEAPIELHDLARLFFHEESHPFLLLGSIAPYFSEEGVLALEDILTLKEELIKTFSARYHRKFMLFGSVVLFALGMRLPQKIDLLVDHKGASPTFRETVDRTYFRSEQRRVEAYFQGMGEWAGEQSQAYDRWFGSDWPKLLEVESLHNLFSDSSRHAYFLGLRLTTLRDDIRRRTCRVRPAACADLVALKRLPGLSRYCAFDIPEFPDSYWANFREYSLTVVDRAKFVRTINAYLKERYTFTLPEPTLWSLLSE